MQPGEPSPQNSGSGAQGAPLGEHKLPPTVFIADYEAACLRDPQDAARLGGRERSSGPTGKFRVRLGAALLVGKCKQHKKFEPAASVASRPHPLTPTQTRLLAHVELERR